MKTTKVMLVDDQSGFTRLLKLTLQRSMNCVVREENEAVNALSSALEFKPDIIFLDLEMPRLDGGDVAHLLRQDYRLAHVPIVFLTTLVGPAESGNKISGLPFLAKPVAVETMVDCIHRYATPAVV